MKAVLILALAAVAMAQNYVPSATSTFCGKYTVALFTNNTGANQQALLGAVVDRTVLGCVQGVGGCVGNSAGLLSLPLNARYFNGSGYISGLPNYATDTTAYNALKAKLVDFFAFALGCTVYQPPGTYLSSGPRSMYDAHQRLMIDGPTLTEFVGDGTHGMLGALAASGVTLGAANDEKSELAYLAAVVGALGRLPGVTCGGVSVQDPCFLSICSAAGCPAATDFNQFVNEGTAHWATALVPSALQSVNLAVGGNVNWRFGSIHNVAQTDGLGGATTAGGFGSGTISASTFTYTHKFPTAGQFFFKCEAHPAAMQGFVAVGSGVAGLTASLSVLAAAIVAAKVLMQ